MIIQFLLSLSCRISSEIYESSAWAFIWLLNISRRRNLVHCRVNVSSFLSTTMTMKLKRLRLWALREKQVPLRWLGKISNKDNEQIVNYSTLQSREVQTFEALLMKDRENVQQTTSASAVDIERAEDGNKSGNRCSYTSGEGVWSAACFRVEHKWLCRSDRFICPHWRSAQPSLFHRGGFRRVRVFALFHSCE